MSKHLTILGGIALIVILLATTVVGAAPAGREADPRFPAAADTTGAAPLADTAPGAPNQPDAAAGAVAPSALIGLSSPGAYYLDGGGTYMDPNQYPIEGAMRFFGWSDFQSSPGNFTWTVMENWINERYAQGLSTGVFVSTYDGIYDGDIRNTPDFVIKTPGTMVVTNEFVDYMEVRNNGSFESANHSAAWDRDPASSVVIVDTAALGGDWAARLGGTDNASHRLTHWAMRVPAMPPELTTGIKMDFQFDTYVDTTDVATDTDHLYVELLDANDALLLPIADITNTSGPVGSWVTSPRYDLGNYVGRTLKVRFRATTDGADPTTFYVDNVKLRVRLIIPKYWSTAYKNYYRQFVTALGERVRDNRKVDFVTVGTGLHGENQPCNTEHKPYMRAAGLTSDLWVDTVKEITDMYVSAFTQGIQLKKNLLMAYMPYFESVYERVRMADYAVQLGVGLSNNGLNPDFANVFMPDGIGAYDPMVANRRYNFVPIAWETYSYMLCTPVYAYWAVLNGLDKHADYLRIEPNVLNGPDGPANKPIFEWAAKYWGQKVTTTPGVWVYMREHRNPTPYCYVRSWPTYVYNNGGSPYVVTPSGNFASSTYPQLGNFSFWLYQDDTIAGGRTVPETNDRGADSRYAVHPSTGMKLTDAGLGNCPTVNQYMRARANYPCNNQPYNEDLPPLVGSSAANRYDPDPWTGAGKEAWVIRRTDQATNNPYMWFDIDDQYIDGTEVYSVNIRVKYLDMIDSKRVVTPTTTPDTWLLRYDSVTGEKVATGAAVPDGIVTKTGDKQIKEVVFTIRDGKFANRLANGRADFVIDSRSATGVNDGNEWIHMVEVNKLGAEPEPTATPTASPTPTQTPTPTITPTATPTTGIVQGKAYHDQNGNGAPDPGEPGLPGAVFALTKGGEEKYTVTSGADGTYRFDGVAPDQYTLREKTPPSGYLSNSSQWIVPVMANQTITMDFGYQPAPTPTPTVTNTPTPTPTDTPTSTPTATSTPTSTPTRTTYGLYLPYVVR